MAVGGDAKVGLNSYVAVGKESTWGTYASATSAVEAISCTFRTDIESMKLDQIGFNRGYSHRVTLGKTVGGTLEQYLHPQESVLLIANALGGHIVSTTTTTSANVHSVTAGNFDTQPSIGLSFNIRKGDTHTFRYQGGRCNVLKLSGAVGEPIKASYEFIFRDSTQVSDDIATSLSISTITPFTFAQGFFRYAATTTSLDTSTANEPIQSFELTINNNLKSEEEARSLGTTTLDVLPATRREIELKVNQRWDTTTTLQRFLQATQGAIDLFFDGAFISGTSGPNYYMYVRMPKVFNKTGDTEIAGADEILTTEISYDVLLDNPATTTGRDIGVTFRNNVSAY